MSRERERKQQPILLCVENVANSPPHQMILEWYFGTFSAVVISVVCCYCSSNGQCNNFDKNISHEKKLQLVKSQVAEEKKYDQFDPLLRSVSIKALSKQFCGI